MNKVYVLCCEQWGGSSYFNHVIRVYKDEELAHREAILYQQGHKSCDTHYRVEEVDFEDLVL